MKIAFFEIQGWEKSFLTKALKGHTIEFCKEELSLENVNKYKNFDAVSVFIYSELDKKVIKHLPNLKLITTRSTGFDHIDLKEAKKRKIAVLNVPYYGENTVAEHTFALILALSRNVHKSYMRTQRNDFSIEGLQGFDLKGKTLGCVGAGHIGMHVIRMAKGFGMEVLAFDMHQDSFISEVMDFKYTDLKTLLKKSDIISLHVPYNEHTHHLIDQNAFKTMKKGAVLINTARGEVVDTDALIEALDNEKISGAGLDVLEGEDVIKEEKQLLYGTKSKKELKELVRDRILLDKDNVVFTPHIAFYSKEALQRIIETTAENILCYQNGECQNRVD